MIDAVKITAVFASDKVLEKIGDQLLSHGLVSGFHIDRIHGGYIYQGKKVAEAQYSLEIVLEDAVGDEVKAKIVQHISTEIKRFWDVPIIEEEQVKINENLLHFIKRAEVEHGKYVREKSLRRAVSIAALLGLAATLYTLEESYVERKEQQAANVEIDKAHEKIAALEKKIERHVWTLNHKIEIGEQFTPTPNDMAADQGYIESEEILTTVREVEFEMRKLRKLR
ncbi:MAG: hypothetical protein A2542_03805 [Parcubacteria group bacterium RIFOXYD2_FULL_52_8]|nr:MAG: hypothetical protein A2542_03805 [Parcubacteria group bacterium RIFOXYD2_FULL_52_8]